MKILIVEDEAGIYTFLKEGLEDEGYETLVATDGEAALRSYSEWHPDLLLLDWMLPGMDGIEVCNHIRRTDQETPIIFLTARDAVEDTISGLRAGANDYIKKPFSFEELVERIKIHFRNRKEDEILHLGNIEQNLTTYQVSNDGKDVKLTSREFNLLAYFIRHKGEVCTREDIIRNVWGIDFQYDTGVIDVFMNALRKKLGMPHDGNIKTIRGVGFIATD
ncbi:MAG: response regulator transcription factor [Prevotella sp.]|nr:response regulator transcription factor [Prevotella sp.]